MSELLSNKYNIPITTGRPQPIRTGQTAQPPVTKDGQTFQELLDARLQGTQTRQVTFSRHATERVALRGVELGDEELSRLERAVDVAESKGITDSLVYLNDTAFIVNIPNKVVVTVVDGSDTEPICITNINGAVIG